jgi:DNA-directed RNA polymerase specialized sigma24 family protein
MHNHEQVNWLGLLDRVKKGDPEAKETLAWELHVRLRPLVQHRLSAWSAQDWEDILQNTFETFFAGASLQRIRSDPLRWALKILRNKIGEAIRKRRSSKEIALEAVAETAHGNDVFADRTSLVTEMEYRELWRQLDSCIVGLSGFCQQYFQAYREGYDRRELWCIAKQADPKLKKNAYYARVFRCLERLRTLWQLNFEQDRE